MAETDALNSNGLVIELKDAFLGGNGSPEEWEEITTRPELPTWALHWMHGDDEERKDQLDELFQHYMVPFTLIEMEILDDQGISSGRALVRVGFRLNLHVLVTPVRDVRMSHGILLSSNTSD